ncbi:MAG: glycine/sarcosine/betaine reductase selenoprotein B family protein [Anaerolineae bacterium]
MTEAGKLLDETFEEFKNSFWYGSRSDLGFKFLASLSGQEAADFLQGLLWRLGDALDSGDWDSLAEYVIDGQVRAYAKESSWAYDDGPFTRLQKPVSESRLALLTSSGHFVAGADPEPFGIKDMTQAEAAAKIMDFLKAEPKLSSIPVDTPPDRLRVRHGGYDIRGAQLDPNVVLPLAILRKLEGEGRIGELWPEAYSFVGACSQTRLLKRAGPSWAEMLRQQQIEAVLLVPA